MSLINIAVTPDQAHFISDQLEKQVRQEETPEDIKAIGAMLEQAEQTLEERGYSTKSVDDIWNEAKHRHSMTNG